MESCCAFAAEEKDLIVGDLVSQTHVRRHPIGLVDLGSGNLLPYIPRNVINFDGVHYSLLIDSSSKCKDVVVLKNSERSARSWNSHICNQFPVILLCVVYLAVSVDLIAHKCSNYIDKVLNRANRMICVWVVH